MGRNYPLIYGIILTILNHYLLMVEMSLRIFKHYVQIVIWKRLGKIEKRLQFLRKKEKPLLTTPWESEILVSKVVIMCIKWNY